MDIKILKFYIKACIINMKKGDAHSDMKLGMCIEERIHN
jgi:hypothetical protein